MAEERREVQAWPGQTTPLDAWTVPSPQAGELVYFAALTLEGTVVSRSADFPEPYRYHDYGDTGLRAEVLSPTTLRLSAVRPTKGVWLDAGRRADWSDNFLDLRPGEARTVSFSAAGLPLTVRALDTEPMTVPAFSPPVSQPG